MNAQKKTLLSMALIAAMNLTACGGGTTADASGATDTSTDVTVERGPVLYAHVIVMHKALKVNLFKTQTVILPINIALL